MSVLLQQAVERLMFNRPSIGAAEEKAVLEVLRSGWLTTGPRTKALEARFAAFRGCSHAVGVNSCTAALHLCHGELERVVRACESALGATS